MNRVFINIWYCFFHLLLIILLYVMMKVNNKLDRMFGPTGTASGLILIITGLVMTYYSVSALSVVLIGAFIGFTSTSTIVDFEQKRIKLSNNIFGIIQTGKWIDIIPEMKIGIKKSKHAWRSYSRSNRTLDVIDKDFRIFLYDANNKKIMPVMKSKSLKEAKAELKNLVHKLNLGEK